MTINQHQPTPAEIKINLAFARWFQGKPETHPMMPVSVAPRLMDQQALVHAVKAAERAQTWDETRPHLEALRDHAAAYIIQNFPQATYPREDHPHIPTNAAIAHVAKNWPAVNNMPASLAPPSLYIPRSKPSHHPEQLRKQEQVTFQRNMENWNGRIAAAQRYLEIYRSEGQAPPFPVIEDPDDDQQLIERAGWQDFWDHRDDPAGIAPPDSSKPAIPGRWLKEKDPQSILQQAHYNAVIKRISSKRAANPADLIPIHASRIIAEENGPDAIKTAGQRDNLLEKIDERKSLMFKLVLRSRDSPQWLTDAANAGETMFSLIKHVSNVYPLDEARKIARAARSPYDIISTLRDNRAAREEHGISPTSAKIDQDNLKTLGKVMQPVRKLAAAPPLHSEPVVADYWKRIAQAAENLLAGAANYELPDHEAKFEIEQLQAMSRLTLEELQAAASVSVTTPSGPYDTTIMLVPDEWAVSVTTPLLRPEPSHHEVAHISQWFEDKTMAELVAEMNAQLDQISDQLTTLPSMLREPPEESELFEEWGRATADLVRHDLMSGQWGDCDGLEDFTDMVLRMAVLSYPKDLQQRLTAKMRVSIITASRSAWADLKDNAWSDAQDNLQAILHLINPALQGKHSRAAYNRYAAYLDLFQATQFLVHAIQPMAAEERELRRLAEYSPPLQPALIA